ncbi:MAG: hypothetical protein GVY14_09070 [Spirochaetes bacterium]|jgi:hypothetical protein|nr:hypothetical protein [Spirochaetota bacterium]
MELSQLADGLVRIDRHDGTFLGIATYIPTNRFAVTKLTGMKRSHGTIVFEDELRTWHIHGFTQHTEQLYLYGDYVEGHTLSEVLQYSADGFLPYLSRLTRAVNTLTASEQPTPVLHSRSIVFLDDGGVLFLPPDLVDAMTGFQAPADRRQFYEVYHHPDLDAEHNLSYAVAVLAFQSLSGQVPFDDTEEEELTERMRSGLVANPRYIVPEIIEAVGDTLRGSLADPEGKLPTLEGWADTFQSWIQHGTHREISDEERARLFEEAEAQQRGMERTYRRREHIRRNWRRYVGITLVAVLIGTIPATILYRSFEPRETAGYTPAQVVEAFYYGMNELDHEIMADATVEGAGDTETREVTTMFVVSRMRTAVEMSSSLIDARDWYADGKPPIEEGRQVYGVADLRLEALRPPAEAEHAFRVTYDKWYPTGMDRESGGEGILVGFERVDRVYLKQSRGDWVIYQIDRLEDRTMERRRTDGTLIEEPAASSEP